MARREVVGKPPISKAKVVAWFAGISGVSLLSLKLISWAMGGGFVRRRYVVGAVLFFLIAYLMVPALMVNAADDKPLIFDEANLLSPEERDELNAMANEYGAERETDFMILTVNSVPNDDYETWTENFTMSMHPV